MTVIRYAESLILWSALWRKHTDVILLSLLNTVFNKYDSVDKSRIRIIGTFSWALMDFAIQSFRCT